MRWLRFFSRTAEPLRTPLDDARYEANEAAKRLINHLDSIPMNNINISAKKVIEEIDRQQKVDADKVFRLTPRNNEEQRIASELVKLIRSMVHQSKSVTIEAEVSPVSGSDCRVIVDHPMYHKPEVFWIRVNNDADDARRDTTKMAGFIRAAIKWEAQNPVDMVSPPKE